MLVDEQNGSRKTQSTIDHVSNLIETMQSRKFSTRTFAAFIDFKTAYDSINLNLLWKRLTQIGIRGKMFKAVQSLYQSVSSCVRINGLTTVV